MSQEDVESLVSMAVARLSKEDDPSLETIRMQVAFDAAYVEKQEALEKEKAGTKRAYSLLEQSICATTLQSTKDVSGMGQMHRLIIAALLTRTGQNPSNEVFQREVAAALESVLPRANLFPFTTLDYGDKRDRLADLHNYVLGIRLFNKALGKGGSGLGDKVKETSDHVLTLAEAVVEQMTDSERVIEDEQLVINHVHKAAGGAEMAAKDAALLQRLQDELAFKRQYHSFLESFEQEMATSQEQIHNVALDYDAHMEELRELVGRKSAVPKERVYPLFEGLAKLWMEAKDLEMHSGALRGIFDELVVFAQPTFNSVLRDEDIMTAQQAPSEITGAAAAGEGGGAGAEGGETGAVAGENHTAAVSGDQIVSALDPASATPVHVFKSENPEIIQLAVEFSGFCAHTMAVRGGLLLPGNPTNGNVLYKGKLYGFVSMDALLAFLKGPDEILEGVLKEAKKKPELINLLHLDRHFPHHVLRKVLAGLAQEDSVGLAKVNDAGCQTPTHFVEKHIDPKYDWNEWSLRRKAIQLANLHTKRTHGSQTVVSQFRRESEAQVYLPKCSVTQTPVDRGTRPQKHLQFVKGLRGHPDQQMQVVKVDINIQ